MKPLLPLATDRLGHAVSKKADWLNHENRSLSLKELSGLRYDFEVIHHERAFHCLVTMSLAQ